MKNLKYTLLTFCLAALFACQSEDMGSIRSETSDTGVAGSYARFITVDDFMYIVDESSIKTFDLSTPATPTQIDVQPIGDRIESIFHFDGRLFIGSGAGLFIYQIESDGIPSSLSATNYFETFETFACDPVVANSTHAYVTLNSLSRVERPCGGGTTIVDVNVLNVYDISELTQPQLIAEYQMTAPKGVGLDGNTVFVCDDSQGLKIYDASNPQDLQLIKHFSGFTAFDVIPLDGLLLVVGPDKVYQFDYSNLQDIRLISEIVYGV